MTLTKVSISDRLVETAFCTRETKARHPRLVLYLAELGRF